MVRVVGWKLELGSVVFPWISSQALWEVQNWKLQLVASLTVYACCPTSCFEKAKLLKGLQKIVTAIPVSDKQLTEAFIESSMPDRQGRLAALCIWKLPPQHVGPYVFLFMKRVIIPKTDWKSNIMFLLHYCWEGESYGYISKHQGWNT